MRHLITCAVLGLATAAFSAGASEIYQWKDANGVTHYSETPPPAGTPYQTRRITQSGSSTQATATPAETPAAETAAPAPVAAGENPQCATARSNIEILEGEGPVQQDDGSGNARELDDQERAAQLELARAAVRAYCPGG